MDPTPAPTPSAAPDPNVGASLIDSIRTQRTSAGYLLLGLAVVLLAVTISLAVQGSALGIDLTLTGLMYFSRWSESLPGWLREGDDKQARWVVNPLLLVVAGAGVLMAAVFPARAEERNNTTMRRMVYGTNTVLV